LGEAASSQPGDVPDGGAIEDVLKEPMETHMKRQKENSGPLPSHDYGLALQTAVSWLGERYLLAEPVARRAVEHKPFFVEARSWHEPRRAVGIASRKH
jgi:hypothetical protein